MSCPYYWYDNHCACRKTGKDVNEDVYYKFCKNYDYDDCPIYKGQDTSGCFLTSACVETMGLPDDCHELTVLRAFRDGYMSAIPGGADDIKEYYRCAPAIVAAIKACPDSREVFGRIYSELVRPCVELIEAGKNSEAYAEYKDYTKALQGKYSTGV